MQQGILLLAALMLLSLLLLTDAYPRAMVKVQEGKDLQADLKGNNRWSFNQLPSMIYNLCALYYVSPDCLDDLFGEDFDISSILADICPS